MLSPTHQKEQLVDVVQRHFTLQVLAKLVAAPLFHVLTLLVQAVMSVTYLSVAYLCLRFLLPWFLLFGNVVM
jgi:fatty-acid desaturase